MVSNILLKSCCAENLLWRAITEPAAISEFVWVTTVIGPLLLREKLQYRTFQTCPPPHGLLTTWQTGHRAWDWVVVRLTWWCAVPEPLGGLRCLYSLLWPQLQVKPPRVVGRISDVQEEEEEVDLTDWSASRHQRDGCWPQEEEDGYMSCLPCDRMLMWWSTQTTSTLTTGWTERPTQRCCMSLCSAARCWRFFNRPQLCCI